MANLGLFVSVEGGEGVGKSVFTRNLIAKLEAANLPCMMTREPGGTLIGQQIRTIFMTPPDGETIEPLTELFLVSAARHQHVLKIQDNLTRGTHVICDRFTDSTRVYQGAIGGLSEDLIERVVATSTGGIEPDVTFFLDCPPELALSRLAQRDSLTEDGNRYDSGGLRLHQTLRGAFSELGRKFPDRIKRIDASQSPEAVLDQAWSILVKKLGDALDS